MIGLLADRFFARRDAEPFAILRIGIGLGAFWEFSAVARHLLFYYSQEGYLPLEILPALGPGPGPLYLLGLSDSPSWTLVCYVALLLSALAYAAGWRVRWTGPLLWLLQLSFIDRNVYVVSGAPILSVQLLLILMWFDTGKTLALGRRNSAASLPAWAGYLVVLQMAVLYFKSGFYKMMGRAWIEGNAIKLMLANPDWRRWNFDGLLDQHWFLAICSSTAFLTWVWEISFPLLLLTRVTRNFALAVGVALHGGQFLMVSTGSYPLLLLSVYACLLSDSDYQALRSWAIALKRRAF